MNIDEGMRRLRDPEEWDLSLAPRIGVFPAPSPRAKTVFFSIAATAAVALAIATTVVLATLPKAPQVAGPGPLPAPTSETTPPAEPEETPEQQMALRRLETLLALVEGWVDVVVAEAAGKRLRGHGALAETMRRRRASGGPAEQTFATLVGLELRPRRLRDASVLWGSLRARQGTEGRDGVWMHPDLLPTGADLDDPLGFREDASAPAELSSEDFDAELAKLLADDTEE